MALPLFFEEELSNASSFTLSEETSKHIHVLRMLAGQQINLTNGKGYLVTVEIIKTDKKQSDVSVISTTDIHFSDKKLSIAISLIKNTGRFEWFLEKATEIGVSEIIPLVCERTEKQHFRYDRMKNILISAMLQSQQAWLPVLHQPVNFNDFIKQDSHQQKYIAHCIQEEKRLLTHEIFQQSNKLILIGPEGDFTREEIESSKKNNFIPVSLGDTRLRTETAGIVAIVLLNKDK